MPELDYPLHIVYLFGDRHLLLLPSGQCKTKTDSPKYGIQSDEKGDRYQLLWNEWHALDTLGRRCAKLQRRQTLPCWTSRPGTGPVRGSVVRTIRETGKTDHKIRKSHVKIRQNRKREQTSCQSNFWARAKFITPISVQVLTVFNRFNQGVDWQDTYKLTKNLLSLYDFGIKFGCFTKILKKSLHVKVPNNSKKSQE